MSQYGVALRKTCLTLTVACLAALLNGCGGGGGAASSKSFGNTIPPNSGPGDAENFFPNATGNVWYYDTTTTAASGTKAPGMDLILITGQKSVLGESSSVFQDTVIVDPTAPAAPVENYFFKNAGGVAFMGSNDPNGALSAAFAPYIQALFPVAPTTVASFSKSNVSLGDLDGDGRNDTATLALTSKVENFEALDTALGSLPRTLRTTEAFSGTLTLSANSSGVPISSTTTTWSAPGIGVVKRTFSVTVQGQTQQEEFDIRGYVSDTAAQGLSTPYVIEGDIAGNSPVFQAGQTVLGTDGTHFLAVENTPNGLTGTLFDGNAKVLATVNLGSGGGSPGISFDGTNYVVAITGSSASLLIHRVTPAGVDLDAPNGITVNLPGMPTSSPAICSGNANTLIAYSRYDSVTSQHFMYGVLIDHGGQMLGSGEFPIARRPGHPLVPASQLRRDQLPRGLAAAPGLRGRPEPRRHLWSPRERRRGGARLPHHRDLDRPPGAVLARHRLRRHELLRGVAGCARRRRPVRHVRHLWRTAQSGGHGARSRRDRRRCRRHAATQLPEPGVQRHGVPDRLVGLRVRQ